ncbi:MAG: MBL fold metallo-hydrolase [Clostridiales bacterium]|nr:MBL fold metallo-hydrolase [Clostridiales bacterium]
MSIYCASLFSGSSGNSFFVGDGKTNVLIDAGVCASKISSALGEIGVSLPDISAIFVTHEHSDHVCGLEVIEKHYEIPVYMKEKCARAFIKSPASSVLRNSRLYHDNFAVKIGNFEIKSFSTPHDSADSVGYTVDFGNGKIGICTDTGHISSEMLENLTGCDAALIEANHDVEMLMRGPYPAWLKERILSDTGHLSNENCAILAKALFESGTKSLMIGHLSKENNTPEAARDTVFRVCEKDVRVASPDRPTELELH